MMVAVYLDHDTFHPVYGSFFFSKTVFGKGLALPN